MSADRKLMSALRWSAQDRREIADALYADKVTVYVDTLTDLAVGFGYEVPSVRLSASIERDLRADADRQARRIVDTYNRELRGFLERNQGREQREVLADYSAWMEDRAESKSEEVAITESYSAYADATAAFFQANDLAPTYDFGGHPEHGDEEPECPVCQALVAANPHPHERMIDVGVPHVRCRQRWHANIEPDDLPDELVLPEQTAGIVGGDPLNMRLGGDVAAADYVQSS